MYLHCKPQVLRGGDGRVLVESQQVRWCNGDPAGYLTRAGMSRFVMSQIRLIRADPRSTLKLSTTIEIDKALL